MDKHGHGSERDLSLAEKESAEIEIKYAGYLRRQERQLEHMSAQASIPLPADMDYASMGTLSLEAREKLAKVNFPCVRILSQKLML